MYTGQTYIPFTTNMVVKKFLSNCQHFSAIPIIKSSTTIAVYCVSIQTNACIKLNSSHLEKSACKNKGRILFVSNLLSVTLVRIMYIMLNYMD